MYLKEIEYAGVSWIHLAYDGDQWWASVNRIKDEKILYQVSN
jgi:uncharacterized protein YraI